MINRRQLIGGMAAAGIVNQWSLCGEGCGS